MKNFSFCHFPRFVGACAMAASLAVASGGALAGPLLKPWVGAGEAIFPAPVPVTPEAMGFSGDFMWYCGKQASCSGNSGATMATFQRQFDLPLLNRPQKIGSIKILANDYFSLYVNNHLVGYDWLDNRFLNGKYDANGMPIPAVPVIYDIADFINFSGSNTITIFACDGRPPNPNIVPGATTSGGWDGCPSAGQRSGHWLLVDGYVLESENGGNGPYIGPRLVSGEGAGWQASAPLPVPSSLALMAFGLSALLWSQRRARG